MKKAFTILLALLAGNSYAQQIELSGTFPQLAGKKLQIEYLDHYKGEIPVNAAGAFDAYVNLPVGYYDLKGADVTVYLEPGMALTITKLNGKPVFTGKGALENNLAAKAADMAGQYFKLQRGSLSDDINFTNPGDFLTVLDKYQSAANGLVDGSAASPFFKSSQTENINALCLRFRSEYLQHYGVDAAKKREADSLQITYVKSYRLGKTDDDLKQRTQAALKSFNVQKMSPADSDRIDVFRHFDMNNDIAYRTSKEYRALHYQQRINFMNKLHAQDPSLTGEDIYAKIIKENISNAAINKEMGYQYVLDRFKIKRDVDKTYQDYIASAANPDYINDVKRLYLGNKTREGTLAPDFLFTDAKGTKVALSSMRGSYVYIDFWATYCIPCIGQIQPLKALEKKFTGKNIRFVSISVDPKKDQQKWKDFLKTNQMDGIQLYAGDADTEFTKYFNVFGIPRFILIDPAGKVIAEEALRPDEPDLEKQLIVLVGK